MHEVAASHDGVSPPQKEDTEKIGELQYFPPNGTFNLMYYPYYGKKAQVRSRQKSMHGTFCPGLVGLL